MIAFIANSLNCGRADLLCDYQIMSMRGSNRGTVMIDEEEHQFVIVTNEDQLRGMELTDYIMLESTKFMPFWQIGRIELTAKTRVRKQQG